MTKEKIISRLTCTFVLVVFFLFEYVCYLVLDIMVTAILNKIFETDVKSDWSKISKNIRQHFRKKLG